jgi:hypothetical protein
MEEVLPVEQPPATPECWKSALERTVIATVVLK